jgi:transposase
MTVDWLARSAWLLACGCTPVAIESTGDSWTPVFNILEGSCEVILVKAPHVKAVPGRKTDKADGRWLAKLMRDHHRRLLTLQLAHIDVLDEPIDALNVEITRGLGELEAATPAAPDPTERMAEMASPGAGEIPDPPMRLAQAIAGLETIPGVDQRGAELLVAEWGTDMGRFGTASRLSAWTGVAPGNDEHAGKQRSGKTRKGNRTLRTGLTPIAHAAARTKGTSLSALYQRVATRRGKKRAIMAVAHAIVVSAFHRRSRHEPSRELGANSFDAQRRAHLVDHVTRRLQRVGYHVHLEPVPASSRFIFNGVSKVAKNPNAS